MASTAVVDLYLARERVRGEIPVGAFSRVSDLLNSGVSVFVGGRALMIAGPSPAGADGWMISSADFAIPLSAIRLVVPVVEPPRDAVPAGLRHEREPLPATLGVEEWHVSGILHLLDRVHWADFLASAQGKFIPVSGATIRYGDTSASVEADFALINGSRITALFVDP